MSASSAPTDPLVRSEVSSDTASVASTTGESAQLTPEQWRARLNRFYGKYNPACLSTVDTILAKYKGHEGHLMRVLVKRWGEEPADERPLLSASSSLPAAPASPAPSSPTKSESGASIAAPSSVASPQRTNPPPNPTPRLTATTTAQAHDRPPTASAVVSSATTNPAAPATSLNDRSRSNSSVSASAGASAAAAVVVVSANSNVTSAPGGSEIPPPGDPRWRPLYDMWLTKYDPQRRGELTTLLETYRGKEKEGLIALQKEKRARGGAAAGAPEGTTASSASFVGGGGLPPIPTPPSSGTATPSRRYPSPGAPRVPAAPAPAPNPVLQDEAMYKRRIIRFYRVYAPDKLADVEGKVLKNPQYANRDYLIKVLTSKYGPEPVSEPLPPPDWIAPVRGLEYAAASTIVPWAVRFYYMFRHYRRPMAELAELPRKVEANLDHEGPWMGVLTREWGPEPETPPSYFETTEPPLDPDAADEQALFVQKLSSLFSQFCPQMLPVVRLMAKEPEVVAARDELFAAAREYFLSAAALPAGEDDGRVQAQQRLQLEELERQRAVRASMLNTSLYSNSTNYEREAAASALAIRVAHSSPLQNRSASSIYFSETAGSAERPKDLVQQAVDLVHANRLLLHLQEPTDQELMSHLSGARGNRQSSSNQPHRGPRHGGDGSGRITANSLVQEASALLQQPPAETSTGGNAANNNNNNNSRNAGSRSTSGNARRSTSANNNVAHTTQRRTPTSISNAQQVLELSNLTSRNQQLEDLVSQLTTALDQKTSELQVLAQQSTSSSSNVSGGGGVASNKSAAAIGGAAVSVQAATMQTVPTIRIHHATQTLTLVESGEGGAKQHNGNNSSSHSRSGHTLAEEEIASLRASLGVREHQNRMLRIQLQQYAHETEQKERQLRNSLACVDSLTETVNMRLREIAALKLDRVPVSDPNRFLEVVEEIKGAFQRHYHETKQRDEAEMNDYYLLANQMIANRDQSIVELTRALEAMLEERRKLLSEAGTTSIVESEGEVVKTTTTSASSAAARRATTTDESSSGTGSGGTDGGRPASVLEKKIARLERELARANAQLQTQNEEHTALVHALAVYSSGGNNNNNNNKNTAAMSRAPAVANTTNANNNNNNSSSRVVSPSNRSAVDTDPFAALQAARQRNASESGSIGGVTKDEHLSKMEILEAARLESESARAALAAELHRRSVSLEDNERQRVAAETMSAQLQTELEAAHQELEYWRGEAEARKRDVNRLVEHVATLSDALRTQKEAIANGNYLLAHASSSPASHRRSQHREQQQRGVPRQHIALGAMDESEPERKIVDNSSGNTNNNDNSSRAALRPSNDSAFSATQNSKHEERQPPFSNFAAAYQQQPQQAGSGARNTPPPDPAIALQLPFSGPTRSNMWSMMYGADQERVQQQEQPFGAAYVQPYPAKGYHIESGGSVAISGAPSPARMNKNVTSSNNSKLAGTPSSSLPGGYASQQQQQQQQRQQYRPSGSSNNPLNFPSVSHASGRVYDPNVTAAASIALARANVAQTTPSQLFF